MPPPREPTLMAPDTLPTLDPAIADRNLNALRKAAPEIAQQIAAMTDAAEPVPPVARTRDGRASFRLTQADGSSSWFGRTSIPSVRAAALLDRFDSGKANVFLPGLAEGTEVEMLLQRLGPHRAVFVWEPDVRNVWLALSLHDLSRAIEEKRLVLLVCPQARLAETLLRWLDKNPGHLCPNQMMMFPWQSMSQIAAVRLAVEQAYHLTEQHRQRALGEIQARWRTFVQRPSAHGVGLTEPLAILALHATEEIWATTDALSEAATRLGRPVITVDIRSPSDMHSLARASKLAGAADAPPALAILIDVVREQVSDVLPACVPAVCWISHRAAMPAKFGDDPVFVTTPELAAQAARAATRASRIIVCPPPCLAKPDPADRDRHRPIDVTLIADSGPIDPAALSPTLPSYGQIWKTAADLLAAGIDTFTSDQSESVLEKAEATIKARIDEPGTRGQMLHNLGRILAPSLVWQLIARILNENNIAFRIHGPGWHRLFPRQAAAPLTTIRQKLDMLRQSKVVICADPTGQGTADVLLAAGAGAAVIARQHPRDGHPGGLATLFKPEADILLFQDSRQMVDRVRQLLHDDPRRRNLAGSAVERCLADHMPEARLKFLTTAATSAF